MNLYFVQDADNRPMHVIACSYSHAIKQWRAQLVLEADEVDESEPILDPDDLEEPDGVSLVASGTDSGRFPEILIGEQA